MNALMEISYKNTILVVNDPEIARPKLLMASPDRYEWMDRSNGSSIASK